jgi:cytochrome c
MSAPVPTRATTAEALLVQYGCTACHAVDRKVVGPAFHDVAARFRNQRGAEGVLQAKVSSGGVGKWGDIPMPANANVPDADLAKMIRWILALK